MRLEEANLPEDRQRCEGRETNKWGSTRRCWRVGTVIVKGRRYCLTCSRQAPAVGPAAAARQSAEMRVK